MFTPAAFSFSTRPFAEPGDIFERSHGLRNQRGHLLFYFLPLFFLALDVDLPPSNLAARRTFWPFLPMASESCVSSTTTSRYFSPESITVTPAYFGRLQRLFCKCHGIFVVLNDVDLFAA